MRSIKVFLLYFIFIALLGSCNPRVATYDIYIDSIVAENQPIRKNYFIHPMSEELNSESLEFQEYASYIKRALNEIGYTESTEEEIPQIVVLLDYGKGEPKQHTYTYSIPQFGQTGVSSSQTTGNVNLYGNNYGYTTGNYSSTTTHTPTYGITGYSTGTGSYQTINKYVMLSAYDYEEYSKTKKLTHLWQLTSSNNNASPDLRWYFPILIAGSKKYLLKNTGGWVILKLSIDDPSILQIKGMPEKLPSQTP